MGKTISIVNQKGGVGKTTTVINLGAFLGEMNYRVLIVDIDPQANASSGLSLDVMSLKNTLYHFLLGRISYQEVLNEMDLKNLYILPSNIDLVGIDVDLRQDDSKEERLKDKLKELKDKFDFILIDCPPSLGLLTINALTASDTVLIPLQCEYFALEGLSQLLRIIQLIKKKLNPNLELEGILLTMYDPRTKFSSRVVQDVREHFKKEVFSVIIPRNVKLAEAPSFGQPISMYEPDSNGAIAYQKLAKEIIDQND